MGTSQSHAVDSEASVDAKVEGKPTAVALTIAGSDPSGGAGLQADLKVFQQCGVYGMSVVTLITAQNTRGVEAVHCLDPAWILQQLRTVIGDIVPGAAKTGALGNPANIRAVAAAARDFGFPLVVDPVMISKHGDPLLPDEAVEVLRRELLPQAFLLTPNRLEAERLLGRSVDWTTRAGLEQASGELRELGPRNVLLKAGRSGQQAQVLLGSESGCDLIELPWIASGNTHGTGCALSAAVTAGLALGLPLNEAALRAVRAIHRAIAAGPQIGGGPHRPIGFSRIRLDES